MGETEGADQFYPVRGSLTTRKKRLFPNQMLPIEGSDRDRHLVAAKTKAPPSPHPQLHCLTALPAKASLRCQQLDVTFKPLLYCNNYKAFWPLTNKWESFPRADRAGKGNGTPAGPPSCTVSVLPHLCLLRAMGNPEAGRRAAHLPPLSILVRFYTD